MKSRESSTPSRGHARPHSKSANIRSSLTNSGDEGCYSHGDRSEGKKYPCFRIRAPFHESNIGLYKTKIMAKNQTPYNLKYGYMVDDNTKIRKLNIITKLQLLVPINIIFIKISIWCAIYVLSIITA